MYTLWIETDDGRLLKYNREDRSFSEKGIASIFPTYESVLQYGIKLQLCEGEKLWVGTLTNRKYRNITDKAIKV